MGWPDTRYKQPPLPLSFINILLSFGIYEYGYVPIMSKVSMSLHSCKSMISVQNNAFKYNVDDEMLSTSLRYLFCFMPSVQVLTFIFPHLLYFIRFIAYSAFLFPSKDNLFGSTGGTNGFPSMTPLYIFQYSFTISSTAFYQNFLIHQPLLTYMWTWSLL